MRHNWLHGIDRQVLQANVNGSWGYREQSSKVDKFKCKRTNTKLVKRKLGFHCFNNKTKRFDLSTHFTHQRTSQKLGFWYTESELQNTHHPHCDSGLDIYFSLFPFTEAK